MENYICINGNKTELTEEQLKQLGIEEVKENNPKRNNPFDRVDTGEPYENGKVVICNVNRFTAYLQE